MNKLISFTLIFSIFACQQDANIDIVGIRGVEIIDELKSDEIMNSYAYTQVYSQHYHSQKLQLDSIDQAYIQVNGIYKNIIEFGYKENCDNYMNELDEFLKMAIQMSKNLDPVVNTTRRLHSQINRLNNLIKEPNQIESSVHLIQVEFNYCTILLCRAIIPQMNKIWNIYDQANGPEGNSLTGDKFLLQPNSSTAIKKMERRSISKIETGITDTKQ